MTDDAALRGGVFMSVFLSISFGRMRMTGYPESLLKGMRKMGALIWFLFVAVVTVVLERESFFP